jgi:dienelactone hydrolase
MGGRVAYLFAAASNRLRAAVAFYGGNRSAPEAAPCGLDGERRRERGS